MPPLLFTSSLASSAPICSRMPWRAHGPDSGTTSAIFTSFGFCARACRGASTAAAPARPILIAVRRPNVEGLLIPSSPVWSAPQAVAGLGPRRPRRSDEVVVIPLIALRFRQAEVRAADAIVGQQGLVRPLEDDVARLQDVAMIRALESLGHSLLDQENRQPVLALDLRDPVEDHIGVA